MTLYMAEDSVGNKVYIMAEDEQHAWTKWARYLSFTVGYTLTMDDVRLATASLIDLNETRITGVYNYEG